MQRALDILNGLRRPHAPPPAHLDHWVIIDRFWVDPDAMLSDQAEMANWCAEWCAQPWRVTRRGDEPRLHFGFEGPVDAVAFKLRFG